MGRFGHGMQIQGAGVGQGHRDIGISSLLEHIAIGVHSYEGKAGDGQLTEWLRLLHRGSERRLVHVGQNRTRARIGRHPDKFLAAVFECEKHRNSGRSPGFRESCQEVDRSLGHWNVVIREPGGRKGPLLFEISRNKMDYLMKG